MRTTVVLAAAILAGAAGLAFGQATGPVGGTQVAVDGGSYMNITPVTLNALLSKKDFFFVNVHIPYQGEIALTDAFIPFDKTNSSLNKYPADKSSKIVLYCRSGRMSDIAARELVRQGYTNVFTLDGGMNDWEKQGLPLNHSTPQ